MVTKTYSRSSKPPVPKVAAESETSSSIYSFTNLKSGNQDKALNAKKLDIDFGGDDFFDSFGMAETANEKEEKPSSSSAQENPFSVAATSEPTKYSSEESGPFQLGSGINTKDAKDLTAEEKFIKNKLKQLEGKKGISSEDFKDTTSDEYKERFAKFQGAKAISSADFFGDEDKKDDTQGRDSKGSLSSFNRDSFGDKVSEAAIYAADRVAEQAKKLKEKATNFWTAFRSSDPNAK